MKDSKYFKEARTINETWLLQEFLEELLVTEYFCRKVWCRLLIEYKLLMFSLEAKLEITGKFSNKVRVYLHHWLVFMVHLVEVKL